MAVIRPHRLAMPETGKPSSNGFVEKQINEELAMLIK